MDITGMNSRFTNCLNSDGYNWDEFEIYKLFEKISAKNADIDNQ